MNLALAMGKTVLFILLPFLLAAMFSCRKDVGKLPFCTAHSNGFSTDIKPVIMSKCATAGCHVGAFAFGDFTAYGDVKAKVDKGTFSEYIYDLKVMPPAGRDSLTPEEKALIRCWLDRNAPND